MQKLAGILKENSYAVYQELIDDIVALASNSPYSEYEATIDLLKQEKIGSDEFIEDLMKYARGANYHDIADACEDLLRGIHAEQS